MAKYRLYRLDGTGRISGAEWLDALNDRFALQAAQALANGASCEVWQRDRRVGRLSPG
jgi:hypothetical protein